MKRKLIIHGCWSFAVFAAFILGARTDRSWSGGKSDTTSRTSASRSSTLVEEDGSAGRAGRSENRSRDERPDSQLEDLFGSIASATKSLDLLVEQALKDPNPITRRLAFSRLLEALTPDNAEAIRSQLVSAGANGDQWRDFHYSWGAMSGQAAFDHAAKSAEPDLAATMTGWAAANPTEALAVLDTLPPEMQGQRDELTASIVAGLSDRDPSRATDLVLKLGQEGNGRAGNLMEIVANEALRVQGPALASQWAEALPDGPLKGAAMARIAEAYARKDPLAAAQWAQRFADQDYATRTIEQIGGWWAQSDPVAAVGWLEKLPSGGGQAAGLRNVFSDWEDRDPAAAGEYLLAMPHSAKRDSAISGFATGYAWQNPQLAIAWAQDIRDPSLRQSSLASAGRAFFRRDPDGARAWLETSDLPAEARQQIVNSNERRR